MINRRLLRAPKCMWSLPRTSGLNSDGLVLIFNLRFAEDSFAGPLCGMCTEACLCSNGRGARFQWIPQ